MGYRAVHQEVKPVSESDRSSSHRRIIWNIKFLPASPSFLAKTLSPQPLPPRRKPAGTWPHVARNAHHYHARLGACMTFLKNMEMFVMSGVWLITCDGTWLEHLAAFENKPKSCWCCHGKDCTRNGDINREPGDYGGYNGSGSELEATCYRPFFLPVIFNIIFLNIIFINNSSNCFFNNVKFPNSSSLFCFLNWFLPFMVV